MPLNTDLALEAYKQLKEGESLDGVSSKEYFDSEAMLKITDIEILTEEAAKRIGKPTGRYITLESEQPFYEFSDAAAQRIKALTDAVGKVCGGVRERVLFTGLGNRSITPDALGPLAADRIFATRHIKRLADEIDTGDLADCAVFAPGVMAQTGFEAAELISALCRTAKPQCVIVCDALACSEPSHMGRTIQLCSSGISPGSGVGNERAEISERTLGVPVAAVGIPTVSRIMCDDSRFDGLLVTPKPIDRLVQRGSEMIAAAVNAFVHPELSAEEISSIIL